MNALENNLVTKEYNVFLGRKDLLGGLTALNLNFHTAMPGLPPHCPITQDSVSLLQERARVSWDMVFIKILFEFYSFIEVYIEICFFSYNVSTSSPRYKTTFHACIYFVDNLL